MEALTVRNKLIYYNSGELKRYESVSLLSAELAKVLNVDISEVLTIQVHVMSSGKVTVNIVVDVNSHLKVPITYDSDGVLKNVGNALSNLYGTDVPQMINQSDVRLSSLRTTEFGRLYLVRIKGKLEE